MASVGSIHVWDLGERKCLATCIEAPRARPDFCRKAHPALSVEKLAPEIACGWLLVVVAASDECHGSFCSQSCFLEGCWCGYTESKLLWCVLTRADCRIRAEILLFFSSPILVTTLSSIPWLSVNKWVPSFLFCRRIISSCSFQWRSVTKFLACHKYKMSRVHN